MIVCNIWTIDFSYSCGTRKTKTKKLMSTIRWILTKTECYAKSTMLSTNVGAVYWILDHSPGSFKVMSYEYYSMSPDLVWGLYKVYDIMGRSTGS